MANGSQNSMLPKNQQGVHSLRMTYTCRACYTVRLYAVLSPVAESLTLMFPVPKKFPVCMAVITHKDTGGVMVGPDQQLLCDQTVNYIGDEVAAVAAADEYTAAEAAELIQVDYEPLPALLTLDEATAPMPPYYISTMKTTLPMRKQWSMVIRIRHLPSRITSGLMTLASNPTHNCFAEFHIALADYSLPDKLSDLVTLPNCLLFQKSLSRNLGLSESNVRMCCLNTGGAFSGRVAVKPHHYIAALLSRKAARPVKIMADADEEFIMCRAGGRNTYRFKTGVMKDGTFKVIEADILHDCGAYVEEQFIVLLLTGVFPQLLYKLEAYRFEGKLVYTNNIPYYFHHGGGMSPEQFALGQHLDLIAQDLGIDPVDLQLKNAFEKGGTTLSGTRYEAVV